MRAKTLSGVSLVVQSGDTTPLPSLSRVPGVTSYGQVQHVPMPFGPGPAKVCVEPLQVGHSELIE